MTLLPIGKPGNFTPFSSWFGLKMKASTIVYMIPSCTRLRIGAGKMASLEGQNRHVVVVFGRVVRRQRRLSFVTLNTNI
jgi:hypothetical protein